MKNNKKRNEIAIFEDFRLKPKIKEISAEKTKEFKIENLNLLCRVDKNNSPISWWHKKKHGRLDQVTKFGRAIYAADDSAEPNPNKNLLKKYNNNVLAAFSIHGWPFLLWKKTSNGKLVQIDFSGKKITKKEDILNLKKDSSGNLSITIIVNSVSETEDTIEFKINSWLRNKAIDAVGLEIRSMKKKAYEYSEDELMRMIKAEENKAIEKGGWKAVRIAALSALGLPFLGFL